MLISSGASGSVEAQASSSPKNDVNFYPNDRTDSPQPQADVSGPPLPLAEDTWVGAHSQVDEDYFEQAGDLYRIMDDGQKSRLADVIASGLSQAESSV